MREVIRLSYLFLGSGAVEESPYAVHVWCEKGSIQDGVGIVWEVLGRRNVSA